MTTFRVEAGFFVFYSVLGFCFICVPVEVIAIALGANTENQIVIMVMFTIASATMLRIHTHDVVMEEVRRQKEITPLEEWREFQESLK
ncbi:MAG TPA: hypothetical protein VN739_04715 [Nitrososphaerales archaeon]|nr:hypothetical protein [Nitrososphaerales archaeon]